MFGGHVVFQGLNSNKFIKIHNFKYLKNTDQTVCKETDIILYITYASSLLILIFP